MKINRHILHDLLISFKKKRKRFQFFSKKSQIRKDLEILRGDLKLHAVDGYERLYTDLDEIEITQLIRALNNFITCNQKITDMTSLDNRMIHKLMCDSLLAYELDLVNDNDPYREVVNRYFYAIHKELNQSNNNNDNASKNFGLSPLDIWLQHVVENPKLYIHHIFVAGHTNEYIFSQLGLSECGCVDVSHDRLLSNVRLETENIIIQECERFKSLYPNKPIKLLSLGTGKGLQDFIIILKLFRLGIYDIDITLVDPYEYRSLLNPNEQSVKIYQKEWQEGEKLPEKYYIDNQEKIYSIIRSLSLLDKSFRDANLTVSQYISADNLKSDKGRSNSNFDVIYAIDFEDYNPDSQSYIDFHSLADCLSENGTAILSHHYIIEQFKSEKQQDKIQLKQIAAINHTPTESKDGISYEYKHSINEFFK